MLAADYTKQLDAIAKAVDKDDWITPATGIVGVAVGTLLQYCIEKWKRSEEADLLVDAAYQEAASHFSDLVFLLHSYNLNAPNAQHVDFNKFFVDQQRFDVAKKDARLLRDARIRNLRTIYSALLDFKRLCRDRVAAGEEYADHARRAIFEVEGMVLSEQFDRKRFCDFLDSRLALPLMQGRSTEEFWRAPGAGHAPRLTSG